MEPPIAQLTLQIIHTDLQKEVTGKINKFSNKIDDTVKEIRPLSL